MCVWGGECFLGGVGDSLVIRWGGAARDQALRDPALYSQLGVPLVDPPYLTHCSKQGELSVWAGSITYKAGQTGMCVVSWWIIGSLSQNLGNVCVYLLPIKVGRVVLRALFIYFVFICTNMILRLKEYNSISSCNCW